MGEQEPEGVEDVQKGEDNKGEKEPNDTAVLLSLQEPRPPSAEKKKTTEVQKLPLTSTSHAYGIYDAS